jgi:tetratricopeptide (TPR) repeat protein
MYLEGWNNGLAGLDQFNIRLSPDFAYAYADLGFAYGDLEQIDEAVKQLEIIEKMDPALADTLNRYLYKMDRASVENRLNWEISRSSAGGPGEAYNFGQSVPETEVALAPFPELVFYDSDNFRATVTFRIYQNSAADDTIDPSHIVFKFSGVDRFGISMDIEADQFCDFIEVH